MTDDVVAKLQRLGIPGYEARAYLALASARAPLNGYEVAKRSGVPRSTVYETLGKLVRRGVAFEVRSGDAQQLYLALPVETFLARLRRDFDESYAEVERELAGLEGPSETTLVHHIGGEDAVIDRAIDLIEGARESLFLSAWPDQLAQLEPYLRVAEERGVEVFLVAWGADGFKPIGNTYPNQLTIPNTPFDRSEWILTRLGGRLLVIVADRRVVITAGIKDRDVWGVFSDDPAVVLLALEAIVHYIVSQVMLDTIGPQRFLETWEADDTLMRLALATPRAAAQQRPASTARVRPPAHP